MSKSVKKMVFVSSFIAVILLVGALIVNQMDTEAEVNEELGFRIEQYDIKDVPFDDVPYTGTAVALNPDEPTDENGLVMTNHEGELYYNPLKLGRYAKSFLKSYEKEKDDAFLAKAELQGDKLLEMGKEYNGGLYFPYSIDFDLHGFGEDIMKGPWYSAMTQGEILSAFTRLYIATDDEKYLDAAEKTFQSLKNVRSENGEWVSLIDEDNYLWLEEYPQDEPTYALNGFMFSIFGVYDYYLLNHDPEVKNYLMGAITTIKHYVDEYRVEGEISYYCRDHHVQSDRYHMIHINQLQNLTRISGDPFFKEEATKFKDDFELTEE